MTRTSILAAALVAGIGVCSAAGPAAEAPPQPSPEPAAESPAESPAETPPVRFLIIYWETPLHRGTVTVNGAKALEFVGLKEGASRLAVPLKDGANTVTVTMEKLAAPPAAHVTPFEKELADDLDEEPTPQASSVDLYLSPERAATDGSPWLDGVETERAAAHLQCRFEVSAGRPGRLHAVERWWADTQRQHLVRESTVEGAVCDEMYARDTLKTWTEQGTLSQDQRWEANRLVTGRYYKPDGTLGAEIADGNGVFRKWHPNGVLAEETAYRNGRANGPSRQWYESGTPEWQCTYVDWKTHGPGKAYHENGTVAEETSYRHGLAQGESRVYYASGKVQAVRQFLDDELHGPFVGYHENGNVGEESNYRRGLKHGESKTYDESGALETAGRYVDGRLEGPYVEYHENGQVALEMTCRGGLAQGESKMYYPSGQLLAVRHFKDDKLHGPFVEYHTNGNLAEESTYRHGLAQGEYKTYYESGAIETVSHCVDDQREGPCIEYHENGEVFEKVTCRNGRPQGESRLYYPSGELQVVRQFVDGKLNGPVRIFHRNGAVRAEGRFVDGKNDGPWTMYGPDGKVLYRQVFEAGRFVRPPARSVRDSRLGFGFTVPEGFISFPALKRVNRCRYAWLRPFEKEEREEEEGKNEGAIVLSVNPLPKPIGPGRPTAQTVKETEKATGAVAAEFSKQAEAVLGMPVNIGAFEFTFQRATWESMTVWEWVGRGQVDGTDQVFLVVQLPLLPKAMQITVGGPAEKRDEVEAAFRAVRDSVEGTVGYGIRPRRSGRRLNLIERITHLAVGVAQLTGIAALVLFLVRRRRRKKAPAPAATTAGR